MAGTQIGYFDYVRCLSGTLVLSIALSGSSVYGVDNCEAHLGQGGDLARHRVEIDLWERHLPVTVVEGPPGDQKINKIIPDLRQTDLVIGFEAGHVYILYGNRRYDGSVPDPVSLVMGSAKIRKTKIPFARGIIIRLGNLSSDTQSRLSTYFEIERREFSLTCAAGACSVLTSTGIRNLGGIGPPMTGNALLKRLVSSELENPDGTSIHKDIFFYDVDSVDAHLVHDRLIALAYAIPASFIAFLLYLVS